MNRHSTAVHFYGDKDDDRVVVDIQRDANGATEWLSLKMNEASGHETTVTFFNEDRAPFVAALRKFIAAEDAREAAQPQDGAA